MKCTYCQSENVQKCSVIYQNGTTNTKGKIRTSHSGGGIGLGSGGFGGFGGGGFSNSDVNTTSRSELADKCSPPAKYNYKGPISMAFVASVLFYAHGPLFGDTSLSGIVMLTILGLYGAAFYFGHRGFVFNRDELPAKLALWSTQWHCNRCGEIYEHKRI